jgi:hypothetical protein
MTIQTLAHTDSLEQLASCEDYSRFLAEQEELTRHRMELELGDSDNGEFYASLADQLSH